MLLLLMASVAWACSPDRVWDRHPSENSPFDGGCPPPDGGRADEPTTCAVGTGACEVVVPRRCAGGQWSCPGEPLPSGDETCNGIDDDCDGQVDEALSGASCATGQSEECGEGLLRCVAGVPTCTAMGTEERCNDADDDCDGVVDEVTVFIDDVDHCGRCGRTCRFDNAEAGCLGGDCTIERCHAGFADLDRRIENGCEVDCRQGPSGEVCNGVDDDCDGRVDEEIVGDVPVDEDAVGVCRGMPLVCRDGRWLRASNEEITAIRPLFSDGEVCDAFDNDCDGHIDEGGCNPCVAGRPPCNDCGSEVYRPDEGSWVCLAAGEIQLGRRAQEAEEEDEAPSTPCAFTGVTWVSAREVSRLEWSEVFGFDPSDACPACPVDGVTWFDAAIFANRMSRSAGLEPCYGIDFAACDGVPGAGLICERIEAPLDPRCEGFRLPTEAEAERYMAGGSAQDYWFDGPPGEAPPDTCWSALTDAPCDVACVTPNPLGICHAHGNVAEWTQDGYEAYSGQPSIDRQVPFDGSGMVVRGGSYRRLPERCRTHSRERLAPSRGLDGRRDGDAVGVRLVRRVSLEAEQ